MLVADAMHAAWPKYASIEIKCSHYFLCVHVFQKEGN